MLDVRQCPAHDHLQAFARGDLDSDEIDRHLSDCPTCRRNVETVDVGSTSIARLLRAPARSVVVDPDLDRLRAKAKALPEPDAVGSRIGEYDVLAVLGRGGMGWVYKARHRRLNRLVALKTISPEWSRHEEAEARFRREIEALAGLSDPHIVAAHDAFEQNGRLFLAMEHVDGVGLDRRVAERGPMSVPQALDCIEQAARGLAHAHEIGIVHRDVKPANLMIDAANVVKVMDLGLARLAPSDDRTRDEHLTGGSVVMGTAAYMAPEQASSPRDADARADIYGLGCTMFHLLTGRPPHQEDTVLATILAHRENPPPSLRAARADCPAALDALFRRMIARRPDDRPASMRAVIADLRAVRTGNAGSSRRHALTASLAAAAMLLLLGMHVLPRAKTTAPEAKKDEAKGTLPRIEMIRVEAGRFFMGAEDKERGAQPDERPRHEVRITRPFLLGKFEITQEQYEEVMNVNPSAFALKGRSREQVKGRDSKRHPVESVSWISAVTFCNALSAKHGLEPYYRIDKGGVTVLGTNGFRLPTEAEWEYACRAGCGAPWSFGDDEKQLDDHAWHAGNSEDRTHPVGTKKPNAWGFHDMHGNVPEWCWDRYDEKYYQKGPVIDPAGAGSGTSRTYRGGGVGSRAAQTRSASRNTLETTYSVLTQVGLRVARDP